ncbi:MAG: sugar nucleotide-binding protein [Candidatus Gottesmanbacteria bacterium]
MNILGTGLSGMVGSRVIDLLSPSYKFENLSLETGVDITKPDDLAKRFKASDAPWIFHFAAYTDVQGSEKERDLKEESAAWKVNVAATKYIASLCSELGKRLLYISTDYVFDGTKDEYSENDKPNPQGFYAETKFHGEEAVRELGDNGAIVRIGNPYRANPTTKLDFVHKIKERLSQNLPVAAPTDQIFVCTFIDDLAVAIDAIVKNNVGGIYHVPSKDAVVPYDVMKMIARLYGLNEALVTKTTFAEFFAGRAPIPQKAALKHDKIDALGVMLHSVESGLEEVKKQEEAFL